MRRPTCPTCEKLVDIATNPHRPFCCERCQLIDLGRWFDEGYSLPMEGEEDKQLDPDANYSDSEEGNPSDGSSSGHK